MIAEIWLFVVLNLWVMALTVFLPMTILLLCSKKARSVWFSYFFVYIVGHLIMPLMEAARRRTFQLLHEHLKGRDPSKPLEVVEIGIGPGFNLEYYPPNCNLTALDMNPNFEKYLRQRAKMFPEVNVKNVVIQPAEDMPIISDGSADVVISTYLHCSCKSSRDILKEVHRILKPGGKYVFLDHVRRPDDDLGLYVQMIINPLHYFYMNGCSLCRNVGALVRKTGFTEVHCESFNIKNGIIFLYGHQAIGIATK